MQLHYGTAALNRIDLNELTYRISTETHLDLLVESIRTIGLIHPPILLEKSSGWIVVSGFRRVKSCLQLGWSETEVRIIPSNFSQIHCAKIAITDNALQRPLNLLEISRALSLIRDALGSDMPGSGMMSTLGLPDNHRYIKKLLKIGELPELVQQGILNDHISLATAGELGKLPMNVAATFAKIFGHFRFSMNKQKEIITLVREIAIREGLDVTDVLEDGQLKTMMDDDSQDRSQNARRFRAHLQQRRFPALNEAKNSIAEHIRQLKLGDGVRLKPPVNFESNIYKFELAFTNRSELFERKNSFDLALENQVLTRILDP